VIWTAEKSGKVMFWTAKQNRKAVVILMIITYYISRGYPLTACFRATITARGKKDQTAPARFTASQKASAGAEVNGPGAIDGRPGMSEEVK